MHLRIYKIFKKPVFLIFLLIIFSPSVVYYAIEKLYAETPDYKKLISLVGNGRSEPYFEESISFSSAAFYYFYEFGVAAYLQETYDLSRVRFLGASSGAFISTLLACDVSIKKVMNEWMPKVYEILRKKPTGVYFNIFDAMHNTGLHLLNDDSFKKATGRVVFSLTRVDSSWNIINERISNFSSTKELVEAGFASGHLPFLVDGDLVATFKGKTYIDGALTDYQPVFDDNTIKVSPYMWSYVWCAQSPLWFLSLYGDTSEERNWRLYNDGYQDAKNHPEHWKRLEKFRKKP
jgi:hypothetical protein